jgi:hypothetical protein
MMRFRGGGVGHKSTREACNFFKKDRDRLDVMEQNVLPVDNDQEGSESEMDLEEHHDVDEVDEDEEENFGYVREGSDDDSEDEVAADGEPGEDGDDDFGPEDDGGIIDPDMMDELGFSKL